MERLKHIPALLLGAALTLAVWSHSHLHIEPHAGHFHVTEQHIDLPFMAHTHSCHAHDRLIELSFHIAPLLLSVLVLTVLLLVLPIRALPVRTVFPSAPPALRHERNHQDIKCRAVLLRSLLLHAPPLR